MPRGWPVALPILDPGTRRGWLVSATAWPPYSWEEIQGGLVGFEVGLNVLAGQFVRICYLQHAFLLHALFLEFGSHVSGLLCSLLEPEETNSALSSSYWSVSGTRTHKTIAHTHVFYMIISNCRNVCTEVNVSPGNSTPRGECSTDLTWIEMACISVCK